jgi:galactitol-specific phosphotransferase system IIB component
MVGVMKINNFKSVLTAALSALALFVAGCVSTPTGGTKPGVPWVQDTVTSRYQRPVELLVTATRAVLKHNGRLLVDNSVDNTFKAKVNERDVWVKITKVDDKVSQVVVMVRTRVGGDIHRAAELDKQIALNLQAVTP